MFKQTLMKSTKNRGMTDSQHATWILSHHACSTVTMAVNSLINSQRLYEQGHSDLSSARMSRDLKDMKLILKFLKLHNPFCNDYPQLTNIVSGQTDSECKVTVDEAVNLGLKIQLRLVGKSLSDVKMKKSDQAVTMKVLRRGTVIEGKKVFVDPRLMTQRMLMCLASSPQSENAWITSNTNFVHGLHLCLTLRNSV